MKLNTWFLAGASVCFWLPYTASAQGRVLHVGPNHSIKELHRLPKLQPGDRVEIAYRPEPYKAKLQIPVSRVKIIGVAGPEGQVPIIEGADAVEVGWASYWSSQIAAQGIITITPPANGPKVENVTVEGLVLRGARNSGAGFKNGKGKGVGWNHAVAAIALYKCENVTIRACVIADCDNGIFGKSYGNPAGDLKRITVEWCNLHSCGVPGKDRCHNSYLEAIDTVYQFNTYGPPIEGSAGCNLKDRGAGTIIAHNRFEGGVRIIDLVDPEDGAPTFLKSRSWGRTDVYGNVIVNPPAGSASMIHFGFDGMAKNAQKTLYFLSNTVVNINTLNVPTKEGRWYTYIFKTNGAQQVYAANNIFHSFSPDSAHGSGDLRFVVEQYGEDSQFDLVSNWFPAGTQSGSVKLPNWDAQLKGQDPGFVDAKGGDYTLKPSSLCRGKATRPEWSRLEAQPSHHFDFTKKTWSKRPSTENVGAVE
jgi:hypothetical protein